MSRVCVGEFDLPDKRGQQLAAQLLFLQTLERLDKRPLQELSRKPLELYRQAITDFYLDYHSIVESWRLTGPAAELVESLKTEIEAWAKKWNLNVEWCTGVVFSTLWTWSQRGTQGLVFQHPGGAFFAPSTANPPDGFPEYTPNCGFCDGYLQRLRSTVLKAIADNSLMKQAPASQAKAFADSIL